MRKTLFFMTVAIALIASIQLAATVPKQEIVLDQGIMSASAVSVDVMSVQALKAEPDQAVPMSTVAIVIVALVVIGVSVAQYKYESRTSRPKSRPWLQAKGVPRPTAT